jgi:hypothetical protein
MMELRTPWLDVPTARLSGVGNQGGFAAFLVGGTVRCGHVQARLGTGEYLKKFEAGFIVPDFIVPEDRIETMAFGNAAIL